MWKPRNGNELNCDLIALLVQELTYILYSEVNTFYNSMRYMKLPEQTMKKIDEHCTGTNAIKSQTLLQKLNSG